MSLRDEIESSGLLYGDTDAFGEMVTYTPHLGAPRDIGVLVERNVERDMKASGAAFPLVFEMWIPNHPTLGVETINERLDKVTVKVRVNDTVPREFRVMQVLGGSDPGAWHVEIRG
ncbi:hypothetical protein [Nitrospira sp. Nam74]